ncbi:MAG: hypothetical protein M1832_006295 [Thelocarpon impressellum]|nr:MAG: hypothetical protein M1832_006295 [Thelocarpon impressellum]
MAAGRSDLASPDGAKLKILMLHGFTQSGPLFHAKTRALEKSLIKAIPPAPSPDHLPSYPGGVELVYGTGPHRLEPFNVPGEDGAEQEVESWAWWRKDEESGVYSGLEEGVAAMAGVLTAQGPFAGVIGFSQGAAGAAMLASLLEPARFGAVEEARRSRGGMRYPPALLDERTPGEEDGRPVTAHPPLRFAVSYSGFPAPHPLYAALYAPPIATPLLHVIGTLDSVVDERRSLGLVDACGLDDEQRQERVLYHPGGHFLPTQKPYINALAHFIRRSLDAR